MTLTVISVKFVYYFIFNLTEKEKKNKKIADNRAKGVTQEKRLSGKSLAKDSGGVSINKSFTITFAIEYTSDDSESLFISLKTKRENSNMIIFHSCSSCH